MSTQTAKTVVGAIVSYRLDYCNSVLVRMSEANLNKFERVQYALARVVTSMPTYSRGHMAPVLAKLHWLSMLARISFKIALMMFKIRQTKQPSHMAELIEDAYPPRIAAIYMSSRHAERVKNCIGHLVSELSSTQQPTRGTLCHAMLGYLIHSRFSDPF